MAEPTDQGEHGFQPVRGGDALERVRSFILAQGWAGLQLGGHMERNSRQGTSPESMLWWVRGAAGEARAVALLHGETLGLLVPLADARAEARRMLDRYQSKLTRIYVLEGQIETSNLDEFECHRTVLAVAPQARRQSFGLPVTRPATPRDADQVHLIYSEVGWMREASAAVWRERLGGERCWVAELEGQLVAAARWTVAFGAWVEVGGVATRSQFRRRGAAAAVTWAATSAALAEGRQVALRFRDPELSALYFPLGFEPVALEQSFQRIL
ncbi:MAG: GNAT family N-acetyltransferase [Candidatus Dormibacteria bacterium]